MDYAPHNPRARYYARRVLRVVGDAAVILAAGLVLGALVAPFFFPQVFTL